MSCLPPHLQVHLPLSPSYVLLCVLHDGLPSVWRLAARCHLRRRTKVLLETLETTQEKLSNGQLSDEVVAAMASAHQVVLAIEPPREASLDSALEEEVQESTATKMCIETETVVSDSEDELMDAMDGRLLVRTQLLGERGTVVPVRPRHHMRTLVA